MRRRHSSQVISRHHCLIASLGPSLESWDPRLHEHCLCKSESTIPVSRKQKQLRVGKRQAVKPHQISSVCMCALSPTVTNPKLLFLIRSTSFDATVHHDAMAPSFTRPHWTLDKKGHRLQRMGSQRKRENSKQNARRRWYWGFCSAHPLLQFRAVGRDISKHERQGCQTEMKRQMLQMHPSKVLSLSRGYQRSIGAELGVNRTTPLQDTVQLSGRSWHVLKNFCQAVCWHYAGHVKHVLPTSYDLWSLQNISRWEDVSAKGALGQGRRRGLHRKHNETMGKPTETLQKYAKFRSYQFTSHPFGHANPRCLRKAHIASKARGAALSLDTHSILLLHCEAYMYSLHDLETFFWLIQLTRKCHVSVCIRFSAA